MIFSLYFLLACFKARGLKTILHPPCSKLLFTSPFPLWIPACAGMTGIATSPPGPLSVHGEGEVKGVRSEFYHTHLVLLLKLLAEEAPGKCSSVRVDSTSSQKFSLSAPVTTACSWASESATG